MSPEDYGNNSSAEDKTNVHDESGARLGDVPSSPHSPPMLPAPSGGEDHTPIHDDVEPKSPNMNPPDQHLEISADERDVDHENHQHSHSNSQTRSQHNGELGYPILQTPSRATHPGQDILEHNDHSLHQSTPPPDDAEQQQSPVLIHSPVQHRSPHRNREESPPPHNREESPPPHHHHSPHQNREESPSPPHHDSPQQNREESPPPHHHQSPRQIREESPPPHHHQSPRQIREESPPPHHHQSPHRSREESPPQHHNHHSTSPALVKNEHYHSPSNHNRRRDMEESPVEKERVENVMLTEPDDDIDEEELLKRQVRLGLEEPMDPKVAADNELIKNSTPTTELEIALSEALQRKEAHIERLSGEIHKLQAFISKRKQTYKRKRKDEGAPTRALSAYNIFIKDRFAQLAKENEEALKSTDTDAQLKRVPPANLVASTGNQWKELPMEEKLKYKERAKADRKRYEDQMAQYQPPDKQANRKRNKTGYNMFFSAHVLRLKQSETGVPSERGSVARIVGTAWKQLSAEDKQYYEREADKHNGMNPVKEEGEDDEEEEIKRQQQQQMQADPYAHMHHPDMHSMHHGGMPPPVMHPAMHQPPHSQHDPHAAAAVHAAHHGYAHPAYPAHHHMYAQHAPPHGYYDYSGHAQHAQHHQQHQQAAAHHSAQLHSQHGGSRSSQGYSQGYPPPHSQRYSYDGSGQGM